MKNFIAFSFLVFIGFQSAAQPIRIAILDFENISGINKYDGLGKAMSSMLISDIESNVSPRRLQLVERAQINKILKEQNLQKAASFDKNTAVRMGKLLGVGYLLIGDIYILDNTLVINARLTDVSTGDIKFSQKQEGKINEWLTIKTKLGKSVAASMSLPFTDPRIPDVNVSPAVLTTYASAINENDNGNFEKAETLISTAKEFNPDFKYLDDLREELEKLKKQVAEQGRKITALEKSDTLQNRKISTLEKSDVVREKQVSELKRTDSSQSRLIGDLSKSDTLQNRKISTLEKSDVVREKQVSELKRIDSSQNRLISDLSKSDTLQNQKINTIEKSGDLILNPKTYEELLNNKKSILTDQAMDQLLFLEALERFPNRVQSEWYDWWLPVPTTLVRLNQYMEQLLNELNQIKSPSGKKTGEKLLINLMYRFFHGYDGLFTLDELRKLFIQNENLINKLALRDSTTTYIKMELFSMTFRKVQDDIDKRLTDAKYKNTLSSTMLVSFGALKKSPIFHSMLIGCLNANMRLLKTPYDEVIKRKLTEIENKIATNQNITEFDYFTLEDIFDIQLLLLYPKDILTTDWSTHPVYKNDEIDLYDVNNIINSAWSNDFRLPIQNGKKVSYLGNLYTPKTKILDKCRRLGIPYFFQPAIIDPDSTNVSELISIFKLYDSTKILEYSNKYFENTLKKIWAYNYLADNLPGFFTYQSYETTDISTLQRVRKGYDSIASIKNNGDIIFVLVPFINSHKTLTLNFTDQKKKIIAYTFSGVQINPQQKYIDPRMAIMNYKISNRTLVAWKASDLKWRTANRPVLGVQAISNSTIYAGKDLKKGLAGGVIVEKVNDKSTAYNCGLQPSDLIVSIDDKIINSVDDITQFLRYKEVGDSISILINRGENVMVCNGILQDEFGNDEWRAAGTIFASDLENNLSEKINSKISEIDAYLRDASANKVREIDIAEHDNMVKKFETLLTNYDQEMNLIDSARYKRYVSEFMKNISGRYTPFDSYIITCNNAFNYLKEPQNYAPTDFGKVLIVPHVYLISMLYYFQYFDRNNSYKYNEQIPNAAIINMAHSFLLCSIRYKLKYESVAVDLYKSISQSFQFGKEYGDLKTSEMIKSDWNEFITSGVVSKTDLKAFNTKYRIINW